MDARLASGPEQPGSRLPLASRHTDNDHDTPDRGRPGALSDQPIIYDGRQGFWSALARWTGTRWINLNYYATKGRSAGFENNLLPNLPVAPIQATTSAWAIGCAYTGRGADPPCDAVIAINGPMS